MMTPTLASAEPLSVWAGHTKTLTLSVGVKKVKVDDTTVLTARKLKRGVELRGEANGKTSLHIWTLDGDRFEFKVHVTSVGSSVYSVSRGSNTPVEAAVATADVRSPSPGVGTTAAGAP